MEATRPPSARPSELVVSEAGAPPMPTPTEAPGPGNAPVSPSPREGQESKAKAPCPPHGAKQTTGVRSEMEDSYIAIPNFLHVNMQGKSGGQEKWPVRLVDSLPNSPLNSEPGTLADAVSAQSAPSPCRDEALAAAVVAMDSKSSTPAKLLEPEAGEDEDMYSETFHFFGVFDGHGGKAAAVHCTKYLHQHFVAALRSMEEAKNAAKESGDALEDSPPPLQNQPSFSLSPRKGSASIIQVYGVETEQDAGGEVSDLMAIGSRDSVTGEPLAAEGPEASTAAEPGRDEAPGASAAVEQRQQEPPQPPSAEPGGPGEGAGTPIKDAGGSTPKPTTEEDILMTPRPLERTDTLTPQALRDKRNREGVEKKQPPERAASESIRMACGTQVSGVTGQVQGQHCGHYIEGVSTVEDLENALATAFKQTDAEFNNTGNGLQTGSTAVCCLIGSRHICVANAGDSRAIMLRSDGLVTPLTDDHKPDREDEKHRVEAAGGQILYWNGRRVMGVLAMSRAIGDSGLQPYVIPDPEITVLERRDDDELIIMGSDGIWDVLSNDETCQLAKRALARAHAKGANSRAAAKVAATVLIRAALAKGSRDNITVIVVDLRPHPMDPELVNNISRPASAGRSRSGGAAAATGEPASAAVCSSRVAGGSPRAAPQ